jgi:hypothetical protein
MDTMHTAKASLTAAFLSLCFTLPAQITGSSAFLQGKFHELGINACGAYMTNVFPQPGPLGPYNTAPFVGLGAVADSEEDGWGVGFPTYCGDFSLPGSPIEGFAINVGDGDEFLRINSGPTCFAPQIPGALTNYIDADSLRTAIWRGTYQVSASRRIQVEQLTSIPEEEQFVVTELRLCNTGSLPLVDVYYGRNIDPDPEYRISMDFTSRNRIVRQAPMDDGALVTARGLLYDCYLGLGARSAMARATYGNFFTDNPAKMWNGTDGYNQSGFNEADEAISLAYKINLLSPGQCDTFRFVYVFNEAQLSDALDAIGPEPLFPPTVCGDGSAPSALSSTELVSAIRLAWLQPLGSAACQVQLKGLPTGPTPSTTITGFPVNQLDLGYSLFVPGSTWTWRVRCACSLSPLEVTPFSALEDTFSIPSFRQTLSRPEVAQFSLFPNPSQGRLSVEWRQSSGQVEGAQQEPIRIEVIDLLGRVHLAQEQPAQPGAMQRVDLTLNGLPDGFYFLRVGEGQPEPFTLKR